MSEQIEIMEIRGILTRGNNRGPYIVEWLERADGMPRLMRYPYSNKRLAEQMVRYLQKQKKLQMPVNDADAPRPDYRPEKLFANINYQKVK